MSGTCSARRIAELAPPVALGRRQRAVAKGAREKLDLEAARSERRAERVVVGRRVGRRVDDVNPHRPDNTRVAVEISYCVCNTDGRQMLLRSISAVLGERERLPFETEVLVLDNGGGHRAD
jgi:hypothetical protein